MAGLAHNQFTRLLEIIREDDVQRIPFPKGGYAIIDRTDAHLVKGYSWRRVGRYARGTDENGKSILLHRLIMGGSDKPNLVVDHEDGDGLNNRRYNLRWATHRENARNRNSVCGKSRFKGVWLDKSAWRAEIQLNGKKVRLGSYTKQVDAARAYDKAALELHGDFAKTNKQLGLLK